VAKTNRILQPVTALSFAFTLASAAADSGVPPTTAPSAPASAWTPSAGLSLKQAFDDNVFLQDLGPKANQQSFISTVIPNLGLSYKPAGVFNASLTYAPEVNFFEADSGENFTLHRVGMSLGGKMADSSWEVTESFIAIDGSDLGPTYLQPGGAPAAGGPAVRDRRDALIERGQFRFTQGFGKWFVRPVVTGYYHDFQTKQKTTPGYQNFVDRSDLNGGADIGYLVAKDTSATVGYRYGVQDQSQLFPDINPTYYDNHYQRVLFGLEGKPCDWLKLNLSMGPEFRHYTGIVASGFDRDRINFYVDSSLTITPVKGDTVTLSVKSFEQPGFTGRSTYTDSTYDLTWRHKLTDALTIGAGFRGYNTDFVRPTASRNDWILTTSALVSYAFNQHLSAEASYLYDSATSEVPNTPGREYTRNFFALGVRYIFK
jgi:hypothetical protein